MHIVVADDDGDVALLCRLSLEHAGHRVTTVGDGLGAVAAVGAGPVDLLVLDGMLPDIDGLEVLEQIRDGNGASPLPVVMVSARVGVNDKIAALERGATAYLAKPFDPDALIALVGQIAALPAEQREMWRLDALGELRGGHDIVVLPSRPAVEEVQTADLSRMLNVAFDAIVSVDDEDRIIGFNKGAEAVFGYLAEEVLGKPVEVLIPERLRRSHSEHLARFRSEPEAGRLMGLQRNVSGLRRDGSEFPAEASITKLESGGRLVLTAILRDATERHRVETDLRDRARQQAAVAALGQLAMTVEHASALMDEAVDVLRQTLSVDIAHVLELSGDGEVFRLVSGSGWHVADVGKVLVPADRSTMAGYALSVDEPVIVIDLPSERRFDPSPLLGGHEIASALTITVPGRNRPYGVLQVVTKTPREFSTDDINFVQAVVNTVSASVLREKDDQRLRAFLDAAPDATLVVDRGGRIVSANAQAETLFGYDRDELLRLPVDALVPDSVKGRHATHRTRYAESPAPRPMGAGLVLSARRRDGSEVPVDIMLRPFTTDEGQLIVAAIRDVTERRRVEAVRDAFLHAVSHELRTPLTSVIGFANLLGRQPEQLGDDNADLVRRIEANARRLDRLLTDLLDLDRLSRGVLTANRHPVEVRTLIARTLEPLPLDGHRVVVEVAPEDLRIEVDPAQLERIVENLVVNATRHTPPGTPLTISVTRSANGVLLTVDDEGPGVPDEQKLAIFEPFSRAGSQAPGTGIGLSLVARFAELHDGRAWVEDRPGGGASFRVVLRA